MDKSVDKCGDNLWITFSSTSYPQSYPQGYPHGIRGKLQVEGSLAELSTYPHETNTSHGVSIPDIKAREMWITRKNGRGPSRMTRSNGLMFSASGSYPHIRVENVWTTWSLALPEHLSTNGGSYPPGLYTELFAGFFRDDGRLTRFSTFPQPLRLRLVFI